MSAVASSDTSTRPSRRRSGSEFESARRASDAEVFDDLDRQLRPERGSNGEPSTNDFQVFELIRTVDRFAVDFDVLPQLIEERDDYRVLVMSGTLVPGFSVIGLLASDGAVELVQLDIDVDLDW